MTTLGERIRELRTQKGYTQTAFGKRLGVVKQTISSWEHNVSCPGYDALTEMASLFDVTVDYLLNGRTETASGRGFAFYFDCWADVLERVRALLGESQIPEQAFCRELGVDLRGEITLSDLVRIARRLEVSTDYLLGNAQCRSSAVADPCSALSPQEKCAVDTFRQLHADNQDIMLEELKKRLQKQCREADADTPAGKAASPSPGPDAPTSEAGVSPETLLLRGSCSRVRGRMHTENGTALLTSRRFLYSRQKNTKPAAGQHTLPADGDFEIEIPLSSLAAVRDGRRGFNRTLLLVRKNGETCEFLFAKPERWKASLLSLLR